MLIKNKHEESFKNSFLDPHIWREANNAAPLLAKSFWVVLSCKLRRRRHPETEVGELPRGNDTIHGASMVKLSSQADKTYVAYSSTSEKSDCSKSFCTKVFCWACVFRSCLHKILLLLKLSVCVCVWACPCTHMHGTAWVGMLESNFPESFDSYIVWVEIKLR